MLYILSFLTLILFSVCFLFYKKVESARFQKEKLSLELKEKEEKLFTLSLEMTRIKTIAEGEKKSADEKLKLLENAKEKLTDTFKALSSETLAKNNSSFLQLAKESFEKHFEKSESSLDKKHHILKELFNPVKESMTKLDMGMKEIEKDRKSDQATLKEQIKHMMETETALKEETRTLVNALKAPHVRGRWGELQLRRVVELSGMVNHCDFVEQKQSDHEESLHRPDMVIQLPGNKQIIVDAKTPFEAFYAAQATKDDAERLTKLKLHAKHIRKHIIDLGRKAYFESFDNVPELVVLFLPSEGFFSAALEQDPSLIEIGVDQKVILATPITLIGLLRAISYGWKQEKISLHAKDIHTLGKELYKRICDMQSHITKLGKNLTSSVDSYNKMLGSLESRVLVSARKFERLGVSLDDEALDPSKFVEHAVKPLTSPELIEG
ncbi:DNA recombination protein RmuC [Candidatus Aerophobetes bacterium]|uniref:DNA recombination protein RmuC n=1 Tax=Aerophobetes bacterium TaxID=2030807 RepID=A0A2A4YDR0_UNCAE|nr:MAG: DNA recombination protein RmuC [Candidatus Aerophobetes bacterium]